MSLQINVTRNGAVSQVVTTGNTMSTLVYEYGTELRRKGHVDEHVFKPPFFFLFWS